MSSIRNVACQECKAATSCISLSIALSRRRCTQGSKEDPVSKGKAAASESAARASHLRAWFLLRFLLFSRHNWWQNCSDCRLIFLVVVSCLGRLAEVFCIPVVTTGPFPSFYITHGRETGHGNAGLREFPGSVIAARLAAPKSSLRSGSFRNGSSHGGGFLLGDPPPSKASSFGFPLNQAQKEASTQKGHAHMFG